jgi:hypothetical protein
MNIYRLNMNRRVFQRKVHSARDITSKEALKDVLFKLTGKVCQNLRDNNWQSSSCI